MSDHNPQGLIGDWCDLTQQSSRKSQKIHSSSTQWGSRGMSKTVYRVVISNCIGHNLPSKDSNGLSDPYLTFNFNGSKLVKSDIVKKSLNPLWNFNKEFLFETDGTTLGQQILTVQCWDWDLIGSDDFIGEVRICLHAVANGPIRHDLPLHNGLEAAGRIKFDITFQEYANTSVKLTNLRLVGASVDRDAFLEFSFAPLEEVSKRSFKNQGKSSIHQHSSPKPTRLSDMEAHFDVTQFHIHTTYHSLVSESLYFILKGSGSATTSPLYNSRGALSLRPFLDGRPFYPHDFSLNLMTADGSNCLTAHGSITLTNLPASAQQVGGEHNEYGCTGKPLLAYLPSPITELAPNGKVLRDNEALEAQVQRIKQSANWDEVYDVSGKKEHFSLTTSPPRPQQPADKHFGVLPPPASPGTHAH